MNKAEVLERVAALGLVPVVRAQSADEALTAIDAICTGGVNVFEITMTVPGAVSLIEQVVSCFGADAIVGAGTVLDADTARACIQAGARFVVSPALDLGTIDCCRQAAVAVMPGALAGPGEQTVQALGA